MEQDGIITANYKEFDKTIIPAGYIELDLSKRNAEDVYKLELQFSGAACISVTETPEKPSIDEQTKYNGYNNATENYNNTFTQELTGGKKYYIHLKQCYSNINNFDNLGSKNSAMVYLFDAKLKQKVPGSDTEIINTINIIESMIPTKGIIDYNHTGDCIINNATGILSIKNTKIGTEATQDYYQNRIHNYGQLTVEDSIIIGKYCLKNEDNNTKEVNVNNSFIVGRSSSGTDTEVSLKKQQL